MSRPKADYANEQLEDLKRPGWHVWAKRPAEADRIVRKLKREGYVAKTLRLDEKTQLIAGRNPQCNSSFSTTSVEAESD